MPQYLRPSFAFRLRAWRRNSWSAQGFDHTDVRRRMGIERHPSVARTSLFRRAAGRTSLGGNCIEFWSPPKSTTGIGIPWESQRPMDCAVPNTAIRGALSHAAESGRDGRRAHSKGRNRKRGLSLPCHCFSQQPTCESVFIGGTHHPRERATPNQCWRCSAPGRSNGAPEATRVASWLGFPCLTSPQRGLGSVGFDDERGSILPGRARQSKRLDWRRLPTLRKSP
jgi:hypothetical protein